jgi:hypothetical protein
MAAECTLAIHGAVLCGVVLASGALTRSRQGPVEAAGASQAGHLLRAPMGPRSPRTGVNFSIKYQ